MIDSLFKFGKSKKERVDPEQIKAQQNEKAAQEWMPIHDIKDHVAYRRDGFVISAIKVEPVNILLLSKSEQRNKILALQEVLNGIPYKTQFFSLPRPVDLDGYIASLEQKKEGASLIKKRLLNGYINVAARKAASGEAMQLSFYIIIPMKKEKNYHSLLYQNASEITMNLTKAGLISKVCDEQDLRDLNFIFTHPAEAAVERAPIMNTILPPIMKGDIL